MTLSWAPHHPMEEQGRYRNTRGFKAKIGTILTMGMEYHIIHHLHPSIPLNLISDPKFRSSMFEELFSATSKDSLINFSIK